MVVWLPWFLLLLIPLNFVTGQDKHYMGGSISFTSSSQSAFRLTVVTGWKLGEGPCGPSCDLQKIGTNTGETRRKMEREHGSTYFGKWEFSVPPFTFNEHLKGISSYTSAVNKAGLWEQEVMETDVFIGIPEHDEIRLNGLEWIERPFRYNYVGNVSSVLQVDLNPLTRNDTHLPNNSPVVMFKPLYRITLNKTTRIVLSTMDKDDDFVRCEVSPSTLAVKTMPKTTVSKDCIVTVEANRRDGFIDEGYGVVTLVAKDFNRHALSLGGDTRTIDDSRPLSEVLVQFMIETVKVDEGPSFLTPTRESQHVFVVYIGSVLEIPLFASSGTIFKAKSLPSTELLTSFPKTVTVNGRVITTATAIWKPTLADIGMYLLSVSIVDVSGRDGMERNYKIIVKDSGRKGIKGKQMSDIYFKETVQFPIECLQHATCTVFVSIATKPAGSDPVLNVTATQVSTAQVKIGAPQKMNDSYTSYISITSSTIGNSSVCLKAIGVQESQSEELCLPFIITPRDPCEYAPCVHGVCESDKGQLSCVCENEYTGTLCDTAITTPTTTDTTTTTVAPSTTATAPKTTTTTQATTRISTTTTVIPTTQTTIPPNTTTKPTTTTPTQTTTSTTKTTTTILTTITTTPITTTTAKKNKNTTPTTTIASTTTITAATTYIATPTTTTSTPTTTIPTTQVMSATQTTTTTPTTASATPSTTTTKPASVLQYVTSITHAAGMPHRPTPTPSGPVVHLHPTPTSGFPSCSEVVNPHPSSRCICLSDNKPIQCPSQKVGPVNSQKQDDAGGTSVVVPVLGCLAGLTAGVIAIFVIKRFCCPCSETNKVSADSLESLKQEDEERHVERKPRRNLPQHQRNIPRAPRKLQPHRL